MKDNVVTRGLKLDEFLERIGDMIFNKEIDLDSIVVIDSFDGYRLGIDKLTTEDNETVTLTAILHTEQLYDLQNSKANWLSDKYYKD